MKRLYHWCWGIGLTLIGVMPILAQEAAKGIPDRSSPPPPQNEFRAYVIAAVLTVAVCVGAMKSTKRTHQD